MPLFLDPFLDKRPLAAGLPGATGGRCFLCSIASGNLHNCVILLLAIYWQYCGLGSGELRLRDLLEPLPYRRRSSHRTTIRVQVPVWVSPALHTGNFAGLLTDLYVAREHRTFRVSSSILAAVINLIYMAFWYISADYAIRRMRIHEASPSTLCPDMIAEACLLPAATTHDWSMGLIRTPSCK